MDYILNFGGQDAKGYFKAVDVFRVTGNRVEKVEDHGLELSVACYNLAAAASGDYILAMGGYDGTNFSKAVDIFEVTSAGVVKVDDRVLELGVGRYNLAAAASGDYILAMGGYDGTNFSKAVDIFEVTSAGVVKVDDRVLELGVGRNDLAAAASGDYILAMGGYDGANISKAVDIFEVTSDGVIKVENHGLELSVARNGLAAASLGDYILAMGGYDSSTHSKAVDIFEVINDGVRKVENHGLELSVPRYGLAAASVGNYVLAMGGYTDDNVVSDVVDVFKLEKGGLVTVTNHGLSLKQARAYLSAATAGNCVLAMGGIYANDSEGRSIPTNAVDVFYNFN